MSRSDDAHNDAAQRMLAAYRAEQALPDSVRAQVWTRLDAELGAPTRSRVEPTRSRWAIATLAIAAALAAIWWGRELMVPRTDPPSSSATYQLRTDTGDPSVSSGERSPAVSPAQPAPATIATVAPAQAVAPHEPVLPPVSQPSPVPGRRRDRGAQTSPVAAADVDALAAEAELLRTAQAALARGDAARALALLEAGSSRFAHGMLLEERAALHVLALCEHGDRSRARREVAAFVADHPRSPLLARVRSACADDTP
jgi:hypothetical protein